MTILIVCFAIAGVLLVFWALTSKDDSTPLEGIDQLQGTNIGRGKIRAGVELGRSEVRTKLAAQKAAEAAALSKLAKEKTNAEGLFIEVAYELMTKQERLDMAMQKERESFYYDLEKLKSDLLILAKASEVGLSPENYQKLIMEERLLMLKFKAEQMSRENDLKFKLAEHQGFKDIDYQLHEKQKRLATQFAEMNLMTPYHEMDVMNKKLSDAYKELERISQMPEGLARNLELKRIQGSIEFMEKDIREREQRIRKPV